MLLAYSLNLRGPSNTFDKAVIKRAVPNLTGGDMIEGYYYLHTNGDLIYKRELGGTAADIRESPFAKAMWPIDPTDRKNAWDILVEAWAAGGRQSRIQELADKWDCNNLDAEHYAEVVGCKIFLDGNAWCATRRDFVNLQESPAGFGHNALEAMAELVKELGYKPSKMWGAKFSDLLAAREEK
jgi:hypothetical protein